MIGLTKNSIGRKCFLGVRPIGQLGSQMEQRTSIKDSARTTQKKLGEGVNVAFTGRSLDKSRRWE